MYVLAVTGSYREGGINDTYIREVLRGAESWGARTDKIVLARRRINYCLNCRACAQGGGCEPGRCVQDDDMAAIIGQCLEADALVLSAPVNFGAATAVLKAFLERLSPLAHMPWGSYLPRPRLTTRRRQAVLVTSSMAPAPLARIGTTSMRSLEQAAELLGARVVARVYLGLVAIAQQGGLGPHRQRSAYNLGASLKPRRPGLLPFARQRAELALSSAGLDGAPLVRRLMPQS